MKRPYTDTIERITKPVPRLTPSGCNDRIYGTVLTRYGYVKVLSDVTSTGLFFAANGRLWTRKYSGRYNSVRSLTRIANAFAKSKVLYSVA